MRVMPLTQNKLQRTKQRRFIVVNAVFYHALFSLQVVDYLHRLTQVATNFVASNRNYMETGNEL